ncbi:MAG: amidohydrolase, partial [Burkholderiales bacterium PBB4]
MPQSRVLGVSSVVSPTFIAATMKHLSLCVLLALASPLSASPAISADAGTTAPPTAVPPWNVNAPPGERSTVQLDVRSGTWMSVDVSPDGKTLLFDLLGDLYTLPIGGGEAKPLTHSMAWEMQARFSPDGKRMVYVSDAGGGDNLWIANADGSQAKALTTEDYQLLNNPAWSPQGDTVIARKHLVGTRSLGSGEIWAFHTGGGKGVQLNEKPNWQKDLGEPAYSPDGRYVYYSRDTTPGKSFTYNKDSNKQIFEIFRLDTQTGDVEALVSGPGGAVRPTPSPDGKYLAFVRRVRNQSTLFLKDLKTGREFAAWAHLERDLQEAWSVHGVYPSMAWLPGSREMVLWAQGKIWRVDPFKHTGIEIPFHIQDTRDVRKAVRFETAVAPDQFQVQQLRWMQVLPQGNRVVYSALGYLFAQNVSGGVAKRLTTRNDAFEFYPSLSRDGKALVFVTWNDKDQGSVRTLDLTTGKETVLTDGPGKYLQPRFSPDGKTVVYVKATGGYLTAPWNAMETGVYTVAAAGGSAPVRIAKDGDAPQFGNRNDVVFVTRQGEKEEVDLFSKLVKIDLADQGRETEIAKSEFVSEFLVSPDGKWLAFTERFHSYVTPLVQSSKPISVGSKMTALPVKQLDVNAAEWLHWAADSSKLYYGLGHQLFSAELKHAFDFVPGAPQELPKPAETGLPIGFVQTADKPSGTIAITGARVVTMRGDEVIANG